MSSKVEYLNPFDLDSATLAAIESALVLLVSCFCIAFYFGFSKNYQIAQSCAVVLDKSLESQFAKVGHTGKNDKRLIRDGASEYWYHSSGRRNCKSMTIRMTFAPRNDMFMYIKALVYNKGFVDRLTLYAPVDSMKSMSLLMIRKEEIERMKGSDDYDKLTEAKKLAGQIIEGESLSLGPDFIVMAEHKDLTNWLGTFSSDDKMQQLKPRLQQLHISDYEMPWDETCKTWEKLLRIEVALPADEAEREKLLHSVTNLACNLCDIIRFVQTSKAADEKAAELRLPIIQARNKKQMEDKRRELEEEKAQRKKETDEAVRKMSREKQIKHEEKMRKKEAKNRMKKLMKKA